MYRSYSTDALLKLALMLNNGWSISLCEEDGTAIVHSSEGMEFSARITDRRAIRKNDLIDIIDGMYIRFIESKRIQVEKSNVSQVSLGSAEKCTSPSSTCKRRKE